MGLGRIWWQNQCPGGAFDLGGRGMIAETSELVIRSIGDLGSKIKGGRGTAPKKQQARPPPGVRLHLCCMALSIGIRVQREQTHTRQTALANGG